MIESIQKVSSSHDLTDFLDEYLMLISFLSCLKSYNLFNNYFSFPLEIKKNESPDFIVNNQVGIEVCFAIPKSVRYIHVLSNNSSENNIVELDPKLINAECIIKKDIKQFIKSPNQELHGEPWYGRRIESDWAKKVIEQIISKTRKLNNNYSIFEKNILLINADFLLNRDFEIAENFLDKQLEKINLINEFEINFSEIFIINKLKSMRMYKI